MSSVLTFSSWQRTLLLKGIDYCNPEVRALSVLFLSLLDPLHTNLKEDTANIANTANMDSIFYICILLTYSKYIKVNIRKKIEPRKLQIYFFIALSLF